MTESGAWRVWEMMQDWREELNAPVEIREDDRFLCSRAAFARWEDASRPPDGDLLSHHARADGVFDGRPPAPVGGRWNFDADNRERLPPDIRLPPRRAFEPDAVTPTVLNLVEKRFGDHFGNLEVFG